MSNNDPGFHVDLHTQCLLIVTKRGLESGKGRGGEITGTSVPPP